jgi:hypothetical protein
MRADVPASLSDGARHEADAVAGHAGLAQALNRLLGVAAAVEEGGYHAAG